MSPVSSSPCPFRSAMATSPWSLLCWSSPPPSSRPCSPVCRSPGYPELGRHQQVLGPVLIFLCRSDHGLDPSIFIVIIVVNWHPALFGEPDYVIIISLSLLFYVRTWTTELNKLIRRIPSSLCWSLYYEIQQGSRNKNLKKFLLESPSRSYSNQSQW